MAEPANDIAVFDRRALRLHRDRAARMAPGPNDPEFLHAEIAGRLLERLDEVKRDFPRVLDLGCRNGMFARDLAKRPGTNWAVQTDLSSAFAARAKAANRFFPTLVADEEMLPFAPRSFDLVTSNLVLHWANDLPGALIQINRTLVPDGLFLGALLGGETLTELRQAVMDAELEVEGGAGPRVSPFADVRDMGALLQRSGFALPVVDRDRITVTYEHVLSLMYDLRRMGETNAVAARRKSFTRRRTFLRAAELYLERFADRAGRLQASFEIIYLTAWAPDASQPKPLRPGSAKQRLAEVLGAEETELDPD